MIMKVPHSMMHNDDMPWVKTTMHSGYLDSYTNKGMLLDWINRDKTIPNKAYGVKIKRIKKRGEIEHVVLIDWVSRAFGLEFKLEFGFGEEVI